MMRIARVMAFLGGTVLTALVLLTCLSIAGRSINGVLHSIGAPWAQALIDAGIGPVNGDFEMVEAGMAFAIFAFLPLCQITAGHAVVDIFTSQMPDRIRRALASVTEIVFALILILIAVQLFAGMQSKIRSGQTSFILAYPVWWGYAGAMLGAFFAALVAVYVAVMRTMEAVYGRAILPDAEGAEH
ncbi:MAG: TRAP transporter small permease subunit [Pseudomonadota bacterium]